MKILTAWLTSTLAILVLAYVLPGVSVSGFVIALAVALVLGLVNAFIKPILFVLTLPINILTLGLFTFVINAMLIMLVSAIIPGFRVDGFWWALVFSIVLSMAMSFLERIFNNFK